MCAYPIVVHGVEGCLCEVLRGDIGQGHEPVVLDGLVTLHPLVQLDPLVVVRISTGPAPV